MDGKIYKCTYTHKNLLKKFQKTLDKPIKIVYNKYVRLINLAFVRRNPYFGPLSDKVASVQNWQCQAKTLK